MYFALLAVLSAYGYLRALSAVVAFPGSSVTYYTLVTLT